MMRHGYAILNKSVNVLTVWATKNAVGPSIAKRQRTVKKVLFEIFFDKKGPVMQLPVPKGRTITGAFCFGKVG